MPCAFLEHVHYLDWVDTKYSLYFRACSHSGCRDCLDKMISRSTKKAARESSPSSPPITIQVQVPGTDTTAANNSLVPQQDCPAFSGDSVLDGTFNKISNSVSINISRSLSMLKLVFLIRIIMVGTSSFSSTPWTGRLSVPRRSQSSPTGWKTSKYQQFNLYFITNDNNYNNIYNMIIFNMIIIIIILSY